MRHSSVKMFLVLILFTSGVSAVLESTTSKTYDIDVPGSDPIRIIEGEPLWNPITGTKFEHRFFKNDNQEHPLHKFFTRLAETDTRNKITRKDSKDYGMESVELINKPDDEFNSRYGGNSEKFKSWDMAHYEKHHHPYEDKKGWVSMEAIPWSISKVAKWESKYKPNPKPWDNDYDTEELHNTKLPSTYKPTNYDIYYLDNKADHKPIYSRPTAVYAQKVQVDYNSKKHHKHEDNCNHNSHRDELDTYLVTDGLPPNFPQSQQYESNRRKGTEVFPDNHPFSVDGDWVLLSTTKGYKYPPHKQRSLQINPGTIGAHRGVRLTVLPPLTNSKVNMTTSHGGLLQVESTFQTVEQAHKQFSKKEKVKKRRPQVVHSNRQKGNSPALTTNKRNTGPDSSAVLAAVGAGMIPATMAMLVPMALSGRKKRNINMIKGLETQMILPRILY